LKKEQNINMTNASTCEAAATIAGVGGFLTMVAAEYGAGGAG